MADGIVSCPKCGSQLQVKLQFASGPKSTPPSTETDIGALLEAIDESNLDDVSLEFVKKMRDKHKKYKDEMFISDKQMAWLRKLAGEEF